MVFTLPTARPSTIVHSESWMSRSLSLRRMTASAAFKRSSPTRMAEPYDFAAASDASASARRREAVPAIPARIDDAEDDQPPASRSSLRIAVAISSRSLMAMSRNSMSSRSAARRRT